MPPSNEAVVFDASAMLAIVLREPGHRFLSGLAQTPLISAVNLTEVRSRLWDKTNSKAAVEDMLGKLGIKVVAFDEEQARLAGDLRRKTRHLGLSLGDRACLALGMVKAAIVYTADQAWARLDLPIEIKLVR